MKQIFKIFSAVLLGFVLMLCTSGRAQAASATTASASVIDSPFSGVKKWEITLTGVTFMSKKVSRAEAKRIQKELEAEGEESALWVEYDEEEHAYFCRGHIIVEMGHCTIDAPLYVKQLNALMEDPDYEIYRDEVSIKGNTAKARWESGNRGGGISDDFPEELSEYIWEHLVQ